MAGIGAIRAISSSYQRILALLVDHNTMTMQTSPGTKPSSRTPGSPSHAATHSRFWALSAVLATVTLLAACGSTPLPHWPTTPQAPLPRNVSAPPAPAAEALPTDAVAIPVQPSQPIAAWTPGAPALDTIENPAVAARFPDPATRYHTPGLAPERRAYTTNAEIEQWLRNLATASTAANEVRTAVLTIGTSQRGAPIHAMVFTRAADTSPHQLGASNRPTVLLIGQQHGDEPAGSEALLVIAQELAQGLLEPLLEHINVVLVPRANPDGAETGSRLTANGADMNRDHLLLKTPEAQALAVLARDYRPILVLDAHEYTVAGRYLQKFNALQRYDALLQYAATANMPEFLTKAAKEWFHEPMVQALKAQNLSSEWYYTTSTQPDDLRLSMGGTHPDNARNANGLKNTVSLQVVTRGVGIGRAHIQRRVHTQITAVTSALRSTAERAANLEQVRSFVVRDTSAQACRDQLVLESSTTPGQRDITMLDPETGADRSVRVDWDSSLTLRTLKTRARPCGYWLAPTAHLAIERLRLLGVQVMRVAEPGSLLAETYRQNPQRENVSGITDSKEATVRAQITLARSAIDVPEGSYYVPLNQPLTALAQAALEPDTPSSYFANRVIDNLEDTARIMATPALIFEDTD